MSINTGTVTIEKITVYVFRVPLTQPVETSFGKMSNRPAVFLSLTDRDGCTGWGEIFANWPAAGAEHRAQLVAEDLSNLVFEKEYSNPSDLFDWLTQRTHICVLQSGEWGPFRQCIAGLDIALHDIFAKKKGVSLARFLNASAAEQVSTYALLPGEQFSADANQAWTLSQASWFCDSLTDLPVRWLEEPLPADSSTTAWVKLASKYPRVNLAGGENVAGLSNFEELINSRYLKVLQPDVIKWGGLTGCMQVAKKIVDEGLTYCPHFLGGGIGLLASAHLLAAVSSEGSLEWDVNPNPLREAFFSKNFLNSKGKFVVNNSPGLGIEYLPSEIGQFLTFERTTTR
jgi:D-galactarolactone cycloisomerase